MSGHASTPRLWTIGHGARAGETLIALLQAHAIRCLIDVRRVPHSRRHPHFGRERLGASLQAAGIEYRHLPGLGGMREPDGSDTNAGLGVAAFRGYADYMQTAEFEAEVATLLALASERPAAIMCAEAAPEQCHRSLIADALTARGIAVEHIVGEGETARHALRREARVVDARVTYPAAQIGLWTNP